MNTDFADRYNMLPPGRRVLCAVSGGRDSVYLLRALLDIAPRRRLAVGAAHFNHRLRGEESDRDERFVRELCAELGVPFFRGDGDVRAWAAARGTGTEEAARTLRYEFLNSAADAAGAEAIATAHNADDNAETMLFNLCRGTGLKGLGGIPPVRGRLIRPLLATTRAEIDAYFAHTGFKYVEDSTNAIEDCSRNRIRHSVAPVLRDINPGFAKNLARASELLREDEGCLAALAEDFIRARCRDGAAPAGELAALPRAVASRVVRRLAGRELSKKHVDAVLALGEGDAADIPGVRVSRTGGRLVFGAGAENGRLETRELPPGGEIFLPEAGVAVRCSPPEKNQLVHKSFNTFSFKTESICGKIFVTCRREGDFFRPEGRKCTKTLKKLFTEAGVPRERRALVPVFRDEAGILAVRGFGRDERAAPGDGDMVYTITIRDMTAAEERI